jgi:hypothetical protein
VLLLLFVCLLACLYLFKNSKAKQIVFYVPAIFIYFLGTLVISKKRALFLYHLQTAPFLPRGGDFIGLLLAYQ